MFDGELRRRIIFLYKRNIPFNKIAWVLQIRRDEVKQAIREAGLFDMKEVNK